MFFLRKLKRSGELDNFPSSSSTTEFFGETELESVANNEEAGPDASSPSKDKYSESRFTLEIELEGRGTEDIVDLHHVAIEGMTFKQKWNILYEFITNNTVVSARQLIQSDFSLLRYKDGDGRGVHHVAAENGSLEVLRMFVVEFLSHFDVNGCDKHGNNILHLAVENGHIECVKFILNQLKTVSKTDLNKDGLAPIHTATKHGNLEIVEFILKEGIVDVDQTTRPDLETPLYIAAQHNDAQIARCLIQHGANISQVTANGCSPINVAAKVGSADVLSIMFESNELTGHTKQDLLNMMDKENNHPLHSAVNSADINAVSVCLMAGAAIDAQQGDGATPVHLACTLGCMNLVKLLIESQQDKISKVLHTMDNAKMLPIHRAVLVNQPDTVAYLIEQGTDVNARDGRSMTPLILAATRGSSMVARRLIQLKADITCQDEQGRTFIHAAVSVGADIEMIAEHIPISERSKLSDLLHSLDNDGHTPLHVASKYGNIKAMLTLLNHGADPHGKTVKRETPLHFAARYGRLNTCKHYLDSEIGSQIINEVDSNGYSPLHHACANGQSEVVRLLLQRGARMSRDHRGNNPLHIACAADGNMDVLRQLLSTHTNMINATNNESKTPLHLAAEKGHGEVLVTLLSMDAMITKDLNNQTFFDILIVNSMEESAIAVLSSERFRDALNQSSAIFNAPFLGLIRNLPKACMVAMDRCIVLSENNGSSIEYDFTYIIKNFLPSDSNQNKIMKSTSPLHVMIEHGRIDCLSHPLCLQYLKYKWATFGMKLHIMNMVIYLLFLVSLTAFVSLRNPLEHGGFENTEKKINETYTATTPIRSNPQVEMGSVDMILALEIILFCLINIGKELFQLFHQKFRYFLDPINIMEWMIYGASLAFTVPFLFGFSSIVQWQCAPIAVCLAWINFMLFFVRLDVIGIYVVMFLEILKTLVKVLVVFFTVIVAFGMTFYMLLSNQSDAYRTPELSIVSTFIMMLNAVSYTDTFLIPLVNGDQGSTHLERVSTLMCIIFMILMPIILMNLLIGLAIGDIEEVKKTARLKRLKMQVDLLTSVEERLPQRILDKISKSSIKVDQSKKRFWHGLSTSMYNETFRCCQDDNDGLDTAEQYIVEEIFKQQQRLDKLADNVTKQSNLVKLILQKMEIENEYDYQDEGPPLNDVIASSQSKTEEIKMKLVQQSAMTYNWATTGRR
ncbi:unnamed protein product [Owenia fusiformis]|uniref:Ion transport domain-containing protein n=1 Tax=Owenia fusiformis TaxID=6347 RepID=A0A8S4MX15_OWEFU|nr:unnamed protein product [Owenia fusiformis]